MGRVKTFFCIFSFVCAASLLFCQNLPVKEYPVLDDEVIYDLVLMDDAQKDMPKISDSWEYALDIIGQERQFLSCCEEMTSDQNLEGKWYLTDSTGTVVEKNAPNFTYISDIVTYKGVLYLDNWGNRSALYKGNTDRFYIFTRWINIIRMIKIIDDAMYVYIIDDGKWILDPIHENGKYCFLKR